MKQTNDLRLPLIRRWYDMTTAGIKSEDYREITPYWINRLVGGVFDEKGYRNPPIGNYDECDYHRFVFRQFDHNIMTLGYPKKGDPERTATFKHAGIEIRTGNPDWGAEPNKLYFVIKHGEKVILTNTEEV